MEERSANLLHQADSAADAYMGGMPSESLFVINLCAANVPQAIDAGSVTQWGIAGIERFRLYQVSRMEDGRRRYRVRLGFFTSEADAEVILQSVRGKFATAFSSCLADEDLKHASGYLKKPLHEIQEIQDIQRTGRYPIPKIPNDELALFEEKHEEKLAATRPAAKPVPPRAPVTHLNNHVNRHTAAPRPAPKAPPHEEPIVEFEWSPPQKADAAPPKPAHAPAKAAAPAATPLQKPTVAPTQKQAQVAKLKAALNSLPPSKPHPAIRLSVAEHTGMTPSKPAAPSKSTGNTGSFHVGAGREIPDTGLSLTNDSSAARSAAPAAPTRVAAAAKSHTPAATPNVELPRPLVSADALAKLRAAAQPRQQEAIIPTLDSTQTIRTLSRREIEDDNAPKWYVVQLAVSDQPANLDTMPRLDIFEAYRLYSIAAMDGAVIRHTLRLGFFSEQVSAEAVLGYLKTFFHDPRIERVSDAEAKRFANPPQQKNGGQEIPHGPASHTITLEEKRKPIVPLPAATPAPPPAPAAKPAPAARTQSKAASPAVKRGPQTRKPATKKSTSTTGKYAHLSVEERESIREARMLGLSDTAIRKLEPNSSLLSRLVDKLTK